MEGGDLFFLWKPYKLYGEIDHMYGMPAFLAKNGFTSGKKRNKIKGKKKGGANNPLNGGKERYPSLVHRNLAQITAIIRITRTVMMAMVMTRFVAILRWEISHRTPAQRGRSRG